MANKTSRKGNPVKDCPVDCKDVILEVDCEKYKNHTSYPMPEPTTPKGWKVNPHPRCDYTGDGKTKVNTTKKMKDAFFNEFDKSKNNEIPEEMQKWAKETYGIEKKYGKELFNALKDAGHEPQMHHNLPIALQGADDPSNYVPLPHDEHQKSGGGVHKWWDDELNEASDDLEQQLGKCKKQSNNPDPKKKKKEEALNDCSRNKDDSAKSTCESKITGIAECLSKVKPPQEGVDLFVRCK